MFYQTPKLETERLILKRGTYDDYVKVYEYDFTKLRDINGEFEYIKQDPEKIKGFETYADEEENTLDFIIYLKENEIPVGNIVYDRYDSINNSLEISCNLHPSYWGQGIMKESIIESMNYVFHNLNISYIKYCYAEENIKSRSLSNKIGFQQFNVKLEFYKKLNKEVREIETIMSKDEYEKLYNKKIQV